MIVNADKSLGKAEVEAYIARAKQLYPDRDIYQMDITVVNSEQVDIKYHYNTVPFNRIRRITGYLVGDMSRMNSAKRAEIRDRVASDLLSECAV